MPARPNSHRRVGPRIGSAAPLASGPRGAFPLLVTSLLVLLSSAAATAKQTGPMPPTDADPFALANNEAVFWSPESPSAAVTRTLEERKYVCVPGSCVDSSLTLLEPGYRLRVAVDTPFEFRWAIDFGIYGPDCTADEAGCPQTLAHWGTREAPFTSEAFLEDPGPGVYQVRVYNLLDPSPPLEMRAKLEREPTPPAQANAHAHPVRELLPNMIAIPPFGFNFNTLPGGTNCYPDETAHGNPGDPPMPATRCLRFAFGWGDIGDGPFELNFREADMQPGTGLISGPVLQVIQRSNGTNFTRPAGEYELHATHTHYHHRDFVHLRLYRLVEGGMQLIFPIEKLGVCGHDWKMVEFDRFYQDVQGKYDSTDDCGGGFVNPVPPRIGLSTGWLDAYYDLQPGNYMDMAGQPDGDYVLQVHANPTRNVTETSYDDNFGYAWFRMVGNEVLEIERGYGASPFDSEEVLAPWNDPD